MATFLACTCDHNL